MESWSSSSGRPPGCRATARTPPASAFQGFRKVGQSRRQASAHPPAEPASHCSGRAKKSQADPVYIPGPIADPPAPPGLGGAQVPGGLTNGGRKFEQLTWLQRRHQRPGHCCFSAQAHLPTLGLPAPTAWDHKRFMGIGSVLNHGQTPGRAVRKPSAGRANTRVSSEAITPSQVRPAARHPAQKLLGLAIRG